MSAIATVARIRTETDEVAVRVSRIDVKATIE